MLNTYFLNNPKKVGFPLYPGTVVKTLSADAEDPRDAGSIPASRRSPGVGNGNLPQYSCLENSMNRGAWWATVHCGCKESDTTEHDELKTSNLFLTVLEARS